MIDIDCELLKEADMREIDETQMTWGDKMFYFFLLAVCPSVLIYVAIAGAH